MKITILRHGETNWNKEGKIQGSVEVELSKQGELQIREISKVIKDMDIDKVYVSPLIRTVQTAKIITQECNLEYEIEDRLKERNFGELEGTLKSSINFNEVWDFNINSNYGNGECVEEFFDRISDYLDDLSQQDYKHVLLITHGGVSLGIRCCLAGSFIGDVDNVILKHGKIINYKL